jgi:hypothetical protein
MSIVAQSSGIGFALLLGAIGLGLATVAMGILFPSIRRIDKGYQAPEVGAATASASDDTVPVSAGSATAK